jgi:oxygen-independent coproporphyrinogen III oxidase
LRGLYVHIPFCVKKCSYCDFYSLPSRQGSIPGYVQAVLKESQDYQGLDFRTLYLGGGTPSLLGVENLRTLLTGLRESLDLSHIVEATIEVNPDSATPDLLKAARGLGINRVSIGIQSFSDYELRAVGRVHNTAQAVTAIRTIKEVGLNNVSADLIIGLPGQTWTTLHDTLAAVTALGINHLSVYCLSLEEGTPLTKNPPSDLPSDDNQADLFEQARAFLKERGFIHYEISNFAKPGQECLHNLNYWRGGEYIGLGAAAASHINGRRFRNRADLAAYLGEPTCQTEDNEMLSPQDKAAEEAMLRLRLLQEGVGINELKVKYGQGNITALLGRLDSLVREKMLVCEGSRYRLVPSRILTSNQVFNRVI